MAQSNKFKALLFSINSSPVLKYFDALKEIREEMEANGYTYADVYEYKEYPVIKGLNASGGYWSYVGAYGRRGI